MVEGHLTKRALLREHSCTINVELLNRTELLNNVSFTYYVSLKNDGNLFLSSVGRPQCFFFLFLLSSQIKRSLKDKLSFFGSENR